MSMRDVNIANITPFAPGPILEQDYSEHATPMSGELYESAHWQTWLESHQQTLQERQAAVAEAWQRVLYDKEIGISPVVSGMEYQQELKRARSTRGWSILSIREKFDAIVRYNYPDEQPKKQN